MARVNLVDPGTASGEAGALLKDIDQAFGVTPNMFAPSPIRRRR